jgi:hypothetical protein
MLKTLITTFRMACINLWRGLSGIVKWESFIASGLLGIGELMNETVMLANHGLMPVTIDVCQGFEGSQIDYTHTCATAHSHLLWLSDWIIAGGGHWIKSPGDYFIDGGIYLSCAVAVGLVVMGIKRVFRK